MSDQVIVVVTQPADVVQHILCERAHELAGWLSGIDAARLEKRETLPDGSVRCVHAWRARANVPPALAAHIDGAFLEWRARSESRPREYESRWIVEPRFLKSSPLCEGTITCAPALGGRGTRVCVEFDIVGVPESAGVLTLARTILSTHFRMLVEAAARLAEAEREGIARGSPTGQAP